MGKKKIIFFGTRIWELTSKHLKMFLERDANIVAFAEADISNISTTVTKKDPYENIGSVAKRLKIPIYCAGVMDDKKFLDYLKSFNADIFIVCGFQFYLTNEILSIPQLGVLNFHSSLLPRHAGMHPGFFTIYYGDKESGMTLHYMDCGLDTGDIVYLSKVPVYLGDDIASLYDRIWDSSEALIDRLLKDLEKKSLPRIPQNMSKYLYNYELSDKDFELDFRIEAEILFGRVVMMPEKFYFSFNNKKYYVKECSVVKEPEIGRFYNLRKPFLYNNKITFITPKYYLQIERLIRNGKEIDPISLLK